MVLFSVVSCWLLIGYFVGWGFEKGTLYNVYRNAGQAYPFTLKDEWPWTLIATLLGPFNLIFLSMAFFGCEDDDAIIDIYAIPPQPIGWRLRTPARDER